MKTNTPTPRRPGLMEISVDVVSRSDLALRAVKDWKSGDAKFHTEFTTPGGYYNWLCAQQDGAVGPRTDAKKKEETK